jgi:head-tail adaptor
MKTGAGPLRDMLRFEKRIMTDDGAGNEVGNWVPQFSPISARLTPLNWGETVLASRLAGVVTYQITVRGSSDARKIDNTWRAVNMRKHLPDGKFECYNIKAPVNPDERGAYLIFTAESGVAEG